MPTKRRSRSKSGRSTRNRAAVVLASRADFSQAETLKSEFEKHISSDGDIDVVAGDVEFIATPCLQIIMSAATSAHRDGRKFTISSASPAFKEAVMDLGLSEIFAEWGVCE